MLVLSRKVGEKIVIGDSIVVTINRVSANRVTLGLEAPNNVRIVRSELSPVAVPARDPLDRGSLERNSLETNSLEIEHCLAPAMPR